MKILQLHPLLRIAACLALGIFVGYESWGGVPQWGWLAAMAVCVVMAIIFCQEIVQGIAIMLAALLAGGFLMTRRMDTLQMELPKGEVSYNAVVASQPQQRGKVVRIDLWVVGDESLPRRVKAAVLRDSLQPELTNLVVGDGLVLSSTFEKPTNFYHSNFDYPLYLRCHGFTATTLVFSDSWRREVVDISSLSYIDRTVLKAMRFRQQTMDRYLEGLGDDEEVAVAMAMTMGDKSRLTRELRDVYSISGASHVLALSGLHLGIIYMLLSLLVGAKKMGAFREFLIIAGIWSYAVLTGLSSSVVRASTMITIYALVSVLRRDRMSLNALAFTAIVMLMLNPLCLYDVGFQMSFMAVLAILLLYKPIYGLVSREFLFSHPILKWLWAMVVVSLCAQLGVAPLTAYYFGRFSVYFLLTNFIVIPLTTFIVYATVVLIIASLWTPAMAVVSAVLRFVVKMQNTLVSWVSSLPGSSIEGIHINRLQLLFIYILIVSLLVFASRLLNNKKLSLKRNRDTE
ncbi:MAG: ComEC/Rec2 family competence protein [Prevotella sp.]|nr:ComEC/Rec2 family competence protein [Prevotella sp.]